MSLLKNTELALCLSQCRVIGKYFVYMNGGGLAEVKDFSTFDDLFFFLFVNDTSKSSFFLNDTIA